MTLPPGQRPTVVPYNLQSYEHHLSHILLVTVLSRIMIVTRFSFLQFQIQWKDSEADARVCERKFCQEAIVSAVRFYPFMISLFKNLHIPRYSKVPFQTIVFVRSYLHT